MEGVTTVMTRSHTDTMLREHICYICRMFSRYSKRPYAQHSLMLRMKDYHSLIVHFRKCIIDIREKLMIVFPACCIHVFKEVDSRTEGNSTGDMRCTRFPALWDACLFITLLRYKINSSSSSYGCLPGFLHITTECQDTNPCICHHLMS